MADRTFWSILSYCRYELEYFYEEQLQRMEQLGIETLPFDDCLCQVNQTYTPKKYNAQIVCITQ